LRAPTQSWHSLLAQEATLILVGYNQLLAIIDTIQQ
jgi:hypothetical protein